MAIQPDQDEVSTGSPIREEHRAQHEVDADRAQASRRVRRHTFLVRFLRVVFPAAAVVVVGLYGMSAYRASEWLDALPPLPIPDIFPDKLTMDNPHYSGFNSDGSSYKVNAKTAAQDFSRPGVILLQGISGELIGAKDATTTLSATSGEYFQRKKRLNLTGGIEIQSSDGMRAKLKSATVLTQTGVISSNEPVFVAMRSSTLRANEMALWQKEKEVEFNGDVQAHLKQEQGDGTDTGGGVPAPSPARSRTTSTGAMFSSSGAPIDITSQKLKILNEENRATFSGNVRARQDDAMIVTQELEIQFEPAKKAAQATGTDTGQGTGAKPSPGLGGASGKIKKIVAKNPITITRGADQRVTSLNAEFFVVEQRAVLEGQVVIVAGQGRSSSSDRAEIRQLEETVLLEGNVVVRQGKNNLRGRKLIVDRARGTMKLSSPPGDGAGPGRVNAILHREADEDARKSRKAQAAQSQGVGEISFKTDPNAPITVEADSLDVDNSAHAAVFRGRVVAAQGAFNIKSATLSILYTGNIEIADPSAPGTGQGQPELKTIVARGGVVVSSQGGQTATGNMAEFDVVANTMLISGDVTLVQGKNRIHGSRLRIDMDTGVSVIEHDSANAGNGWASSVDGANGGTGREGGGRPAAFDARGGRPNAVFYPFQLKKKREQDKARKKAGQTQGTTQPAQQPASGADASQGAVVGPSGWSATSAPAN